MSFITLFSTVLLFLWARQVPGKASHAHVPQVVHDILSVGSIVMLALHNQAACKRDLRFRFAKRGEVGCWIKYPEAPSLHASNHPKGDPFSTPQTRHA